MVIELLIPCRCAEVLVLVMFTMLALLWLTREPRFIPGWGEGFKTEDSGKRYTSLSHDAFCTVLLAS